MAARPRSRCTAARAKRATAIPPTGTRLPRSRAAVPVPVIGNGDLLFAHEIQRAFASTGVRGGDDRARRADQAVDLPRSVVRLLGHHRRRTARDLPALRRAGLEHWRAGCDDSTTTAARGCANSCAGTSASGAAMRRSGRTASWPTMQQREAAFERASPLEALLARTDDAALDYMTDELLTAATCPTRRPRARRRRRPISSRPDDARARPSWRRRCAQPTQVAASAGRHASAAPSSTRRPTRRSPTRRSPSSSSRARSGPSADGRFEFANVKPGTYTLTVSTIGYIFVRRHVDGARRDATSRLTVPLAEGTGTYQETVTVAADATTPPSAWRRHRRWNWDPPGSRICAASPPTIRCARCRRCPASRPATTFRPSSRCAARRSGTSAS